jgi:uncharacterized membrane protein
MWILKFLPDWIFYVILLAGIIGLVLTYFTKFISFIPGVSAYTIPIRIGSYLALVIGIFMSGAIHDNASWKERVDEMQEKVAEAEKQSKVANTAINQKTRQKLAQNQQKTLIVKQYIDREVTKYDSQCVIPKEFIKAVNDATEVNK